MWISNKIKSITGLFTLVCFIGLMPPEAGSQDLSFLSDTTRYIWPTDASPYISSTFGETRSAHFHAGLDIRTWGTEGYRVFATRDGIVYRMSIGPSGYGKVIYLKHNDSSFSVYAHLNRFESSLMAVVDSLRLKDYTFLLDENIEHKEIRVRQGDLIGYTGSTGVGPPHLHFELRTPENEPFNPLLTNLSIDDDLPPEFSSIALEHLDPETFHVNHIETRRARRHGREFSFGTLDASGPVGLSVNVHDRANRTPNYYAVYGLTLIHEQDTLFQSKVDLFNYKDASQMFIDRVFPILNERRQGFQRLYVVNGNKLPFYETGNTRGVIDLPEGIYDLNIIAEDYFGNKTTGSLELRITDRGSEPSDYIAGIPAYSRNGGYHERIPEATNARNFTRSFHAPLLTDRSGTTGPSDELSLDQTPIFFTRESTVRRVGKKLVPGKRQFLHLPDQTIWVEFPEDALFDTLFVEMTVKYQDNLPVIQFYPDHLPLKNKARINIVLPVTEERQSIGLYSYNDPRNRLRFQASAESGSILQANINQLQQFQLREDHHPAYVGRPRILQNQGGMHVVHLPVTDGMSGIDYLRSRIEVNGERGIIEYDPDKEILIFYKPGFQPRPENRIEAWVYDGVGNQSHHIYDAVIYNR
jgi:hypothetical protein